MTNRGDSFRQALKLNPELAAEQEEYEHNALMKRARRIDEQMQLDGIKPVDESEHEIQARLYRRICNAGLCCFAIPNGANFFVGEGLMKAEIESAFDRGAVQFAQALQALHKRMEGQRHGQFAKLKAEGLTPGVPDLLVAEPVLGFPSATAVIRKYWDASKSYKDMPELAIALVECYVPGLFLETKYPGRPLSKNQKKMMIELRGRRFRCEKYDSVEHGWAIVCNMYGIEQ